MSLGELRPGVHAHDGRRFLDGGDVSGQELLQVADCSRVMSPTPVMGSVEQVDQGRRAFAASLDKLHERRRAQKRFKQDILLILAVGRSVIRRVVHAAQPQRRPVVILRRPVTVGDAGIDGGQNAPKR